MIRPKREIPVGECFGWEVRGGLRYEGGELLDLDAGIDEQLFNETFPELDIFWDQQIIHVFLKYSLEPFL